MSYDAHHTLSDPARPRAQLWRLGLGIVIFGVLSVLLQVFIIGFLVGALALEGGGVDGISVVVAGRAPASVIVVLLSFVGYFAALAVVVIALHHRTLPELFGPLAAGLRQAGRLILWLIPLLLVVSFLPTPYTLEVSRSITLGAWIGLMPLALLGLLIQVSAEEFVFRGYLQSQLAARFAHPAIWIGVPAVLFGVLHHDSSIYGENAWAITLWAILFGLVAGDITARAGTLGPAIALHLVNNFYAFMIAAPSGYMDGLALYTYPFYPADPELLMAWYPTELLTLLCIWLLARLSLRR